MWARCTNHIHPAIWLHKMHVWLTGGWTVKTRLYEAKLWTSLHKTRRMNVIRLHEAPVLVGMRQHSEKERRATALCVPVSCQLKFQQHRSTGYNQWSNKQSVRWEVCITDWNDSCCPGGNNYHKLEIPHTPGHIRVQGKRFACVLPFKARHFRANLGNVKLG